MDDARIDLRVMGFAVFVTMLTSVLFGMLPSLSATRINLVEFLKSSGMRGVAGDRKRVRHGLAVAQIALLVVLLTGTGLLLRMQTCFRCRRDSPLQLSRRVCR